LYFTLKSVLGIGLVLLLVLAGRNAEAHNRVEHSAESAAQAAALQRNPDAAIRAATITATAPDAASRPRVVPVALTRPDCQPSGWSAAVDVPPPPEMASSAAPEGDAARDVRGEAGAQSR